MATKKKPEQEDPLAGFVGILHHLAKDKPVSVEEMKAARRPYPGTGKVRTPKTKP